MSIYSQSCREEINSVFSFPSASSSTNWMWVGCLYLLLLLCWNATLGCLGVGESGERTVPKIAQLCRHFPFGTLLVINPTLTPLDVRAGVTWVGRSHLKLRCFNTSFSVHARWVGKLKHNFLMCSVGGKPLKCLESRLSCAPTRASIQPFWF